MKIKLSLIIAILIFSYFGYQLLNQTPKEAKIFQVTGGAGPVSLTLNPASPTIPANTTTNLTLNIDTGTAKATAVSVELAYLSGKCVTPITVAKGDFFTVVLAAPKVTGNKISFTYAAPPDSGGKQGTGTLATITTGPTTASCVLSFTQNTLAAAIGFPSNALASASDAAINLIGAPPISPSPSAVASASPNPIKQRVYEKYGEKGLAVLCKNFGICDE